MTLAYTFEPIILFNLMLTIGFLFIILYFKARNINKNLIYIKLLFVCTTIVRMISTIAYFNS